MLQSKKYFLQLFQYYHRLDGAKASAAAGADAFIDDVIAKLCITVACYMIWS